MQTEILKTNKTLNLIRAILMLTKETQDTKDKVLLINLEKVSYDLLDTAHNDKENARNKLVYLYDLFLLAKQVNLFKIENTDFILMVIKSLREDYETTFISNKRQSKVEDLKDIMTLEEVKSDIKDREEFEIALEKKLETKTEFKTEMKKIEVRKTDNRQIRNVSAKTDSFDQEVRDIQNNRKLSRREEVLRTLSTVPVSIKDVSEKVLGCSEKTIQRELNALVDTRQAIRIGEKRWSRYVLA